MSRAQVMNLGQLLAQTARQFGALPGVIQGDQRWSWAEIDTRVNALVAALRARGVGKGDKILVHSRNNLAMFESCWVAFRLGAVWVPTNWRLTPPEVAYLGSSGDASVMIVESAFAGHADAVRAACPNLRCVVAIGTPREDLGELDFEALISAQRRAHPARLDAASGHNNGNNGNNGDNGKFMLEEAARPADVEAHDPLWFFYTSGTTGKPKAAVLTHGQMAFVVANHLADLIPGTTERDCSAAVAPLSHGAGIHALLNVARGAATVLMPGEKLDPAVFWALVQEHRISNLFTVPTIVKLLVEHPSVDEFDHRSLRYVIYAGAPMYRADQRRALQKLGPVLVQYFGLGEVTGCITVLPAHLHSADDASPLAHIGSCGRPRTGMEVAVLDAQMQPLPTGEIGEICCRGPAVFAGYHGNPEATEQALRGGWFHTGDLGRLDAQGLLYITGRESDMYISGGSNVYPREVEEVLLTHPGVAEVAVLGIPDAQWGEVGVAVVVRRHEPEGGVGVGTGTGAAPASSPALDAAALLAHLDGRCARYRWPRHVVFWDALPKSGYGKIVKKDIRAALLAPRGDLAVAGLIAAE